MSLRTFQPKNLNAQLVDLLGERVVQGHYAEGQQLPVEADLCAEFGISRPILREATKILISKGLLTSRPRVGTVVRERSYWNLLDGQVLAWVTQSLPASDFLDMLFEARIAIEPSAAELAASKAVEADIERIRQAYHDMANALSVEASLEPDIRFHQAIMDATHNDVVRYIGQTLHNALAISIRLTSWSEHIHALSLVRHEAVFLAIEARDGGKAREATRVLLLESRKDFDVKVAGTE